MIRSGYHISRRTLDHGYVSGLVAHGRHQRHGRRTAANHHHALAGVIKVLRPVLWMYHRAREVIDAFELRRVTGFVVVVAAAHHQKVAAVFHQGAIMLCGHRPLSMLRRPVGTFDHVVVTDVVAHTIFHRRLLQIFADGGAVGNGLGFPPGFEIEPQRVHVTVGTNTRIAEQIPGAAECAATFKNGVGFSRTLVDQMDRRTNPGYARPYDQYVKNIRLLYFLTHNYSSSKNTIGLCSQVWRLNDRPQVYPATCIARLHDAR